MTSVEDQQAVRNRAIEVQRRVQQRVGSPVRRMGEPAEVVRRRGDGEPAPLSISQRQLWYLAQAFPESTAYNELVTLRKDGPFEVDAFRWAFGEFVRRHEAWRTTFRIVDGEPRQVVHPALPPVDFEIALLDLSDVPRADAERRAVELAAEETSRPYDLTTDPLVRPRLVRFADDHHRLYLGLHHLVFDGVTLSRILLPEIVALYDAAVAGRGSPLPEPRVQYPDYAAWEIAWMDSPAATARVQRWRQRLAGVPTLELPLDHSRPAERRFTGGLVPLTIDADTIAALRATGRRVNASLFHVVAALHAWWLGCYAGSDDVVFATVGDLRQRPELVGMAGYCLAPVVIRIEVQAATGGGEDPDRGPTTVQLTGRVRDRILDSLDDIVPFERLVRDLGVPRDPRMNPIFQTDLVLEPPMSVSDPQWSLQPMENAVVAMVARSKFDLSIELDERPDGHVQGRLFYDADLFDPGTAAAMARHWLTLLERAAAEPDRPLAELDLVGAGERDRLLADPAAPTGAGPAAGSGPATVHEVVRAQAARTPGAVAVVAGDRTLTYEELQLAADEVGRQLAAAGAGVGTFVAAVFDRTVDLVVGLLGVLTCGAAYVPLSPQDPADRLQALVEDSGSALVLTTTALLPGLPALGVPALTVDGPAADGGAQVAVPPPAAAPDDLAYLIYTSGSTGTPKGVLVEHRSVTELMATLLPAMGLSAADTVVCVTSYTFDMSVGSIFGALALGSRLILASADQVADPRALAALLESAGATYMAATPTTWSALLESGWSGAPCLVADCGGEALPAALAAALTRRCAAVWNWYGPTEATDAVAGGRVVPGEPVAVGRPLPGARVHVLDPHLRLVPAGVPGEVVIGGSGVARGYLDRPAETARRFVPDPFVDGGRVYRTGDRGRFLPDGRLQLLGRLDDQLKIRGVRIEPGEIEAVLITHPDISAAVVVARPDRAGQQRLVAYLVADPDGPGDAAIRSWVRARLPAPLVPSVLVRLAALPRTAGGKVDRAALPEPQGSTDLGVSHGRVPASPTERHVAEIWSAALETEIVDVDADFFDLGGHSLLAARVIGEVDRRFGTRVRLSDFLRRGTTVAGLAELVDSAGAAGEVAAARVSRPGSQELVRPLFVVYPDVTTAVGLRHLAAEFGSRQPIYPLLPHEMFGRFDRVAGLEGLARTMLAELRHEQPAGPYALAGFSLGGLLAYDIARQLTELGEDVEWLGLLDAGTPEITTAIFQTMVAMSGRRARQRQRTRRERWAKYVEVAGRMISRQVLTRIRGTTPPQQFDDHGAQAIAHAYARPGHELPMEVFVTADSLAATGSDTLGWTEMHRGPLGVHRLAGDHLALLQPPLVHDVARLILAGLQQARARSGTQ